MGSFVTNLVSVLDQLIPVAEVVVGAIAIMGALRIAPMLVKRFL